MPEAVLPTDRTDRSAVKSRQLGSRSRRPVLTPQLPDRSQELGADLDLGPFKPLARDICLHSLLQRGGLKGEILFFPQLCGQPFESRNRFFLLYLI